jgi:GT2 family glycosyltransferase
MKVIMPCWLINEELVTLTRSAVDSLGKVELIIIDNGSPMGGGMLREMADIYIRNKENLGYAKAVNQGLKLCKQDELIAISNNDIRVSEGWDKIAEEILIRPDIGSVHFRMIDYTKPFDLGSDTWSSGKERWCTSSFFVVRNVQLYDENYFNSYDDWNFWNEMRRKGYKQAYTNKAQYQHRDSFSQQFIPNRNENDQRNREYFKKKWGKYAEELFEEEFPGQLALPWKPMP